MEPVTKIRLLGGEHAIVLPDFAAREDIFHAYGQTYEKGGVPHLRVLAAAIGLCTRLGRQSGADYGAHGYSALAYGGQVYGWLREHGAKPAEIREVGVPIILAIHGALFPRQSEVEQAEGNSGAGEES